MKPVSELSAIAPYFQAEHGGMFLADSLEIMGKLAEGDVNLIMTSPPFGLVRKKEYGNVDSDEYLDWFRPFAEQFYRILAHNGSLVIDIGGAWHKGNPTRSLYHFKLLIMLCEEFGFHLAQEFYWWNPSKLPTPAEWVNVRRVRVKDAVNTVWWLAKTPFPKASNARVLQPYSDSMLDLLQNGYKPKLRPSGHDISAKFSINNGGAIPPNLLAISNTESNGQYMRYCKENNIKMHPARFPGELPEFFIRMLTDEHDRVLDPFAGSCVTGEVCERLRRRWICCDTVEEYLRGALGRFAAAGTTVNADSAPATYSISKPGTLWNGIPTDRLDPAGGKERPPKRDDGATAPAHHAPRAEEWSLLNFLP